MARLVPVSPDLYNYDFIPIDPASKLTLGRGEITGLSDVHVSRNQLVVELIQNSDSSEPYLEIQVVSSHLFQIDHFNKLINSLFRLDEKPVTYFVTQ
jgi:hypothetical protein